MYFADTATTKTSRPTFWNAKRSRRCSCGPPRCWTAAWTWAVRTIRSTIATGTRTRTKIVIRPFWRNGTRTTCRAAVAAEVEAEAFAAAACTRPATKTTSARSAFGPKMRSRPSYDTGARLRQSCCTIFALPVLDGGGGSWKTIANCSHGRSPAVGSSY